MAPVPKKIFWLACIVAVLSFRLFVQAEAKPYFIDERISINTACGDTTVQVYPDSVLQGMLDSHTEKGDLGRKIFDANIRNDRSNGLLYSYTLSGWLRLFSCSLFAYRSLSMVFFALLIGLILYFHQQNSRTIWFLLLLLLSNSLFAHYSIECRTYLMTTTLCFASTLTVFEYIRRPQNKWLALYFPLVLLSIFSHYLCVVVFCWHFFLLMYRPGQKEKWKLLFCYVAFAAVLAGILYILDSQTGFIKKLSQASETISDNAAKGMEIREPATAKFVAAGYIRALLQVFGIMFQNILRARFYTFLILPLAFLIYKAHPYISKQTRVRIYSLFIIHSVYMLVITLLSRNTIIMQPKYSIFVMPFYILYLAELVEKIPMKSAYKIALKVFLIVGGLAETAAEIFPQLRIN